MGKKIKEIKWSSVALEGFPISKESFNGFVGLEECTDYGFLDKDTKKPQKVKPVKEKKRKSNQSDTEVSSKKSKLGKAINNVKLSNGFIVETCEKAKPSLSESTTTRKKSKIEKTSSDKTVKLQQKSVTKTAKKTKPKLGVNIVESDSQLTLEEMDAWSSFQIPDEILRGLAEQGFKKPTRIQELILPPAMLGRRDILGAAQTGSGKTLAFGIPILAGIMKLKEQAASGVDIYEMPYKKSSSKKKVIETTENIPKQKNSMKKKGNKKIKCNKVISSEEGYSSGEDDKKEAFDNDKEDNENLSNEESGDENDDSQDKEVVDEFLEEYDVPIKKRDQSDDGNESDDSDNNGVHLSDMLDSDDIADSSDDENDYVEGNDDSSAASDEDTDSQNECKDDEVENKEEDVNDNEVGCVKVIDDIELPGPVVTKTGKPLYALILTPTRELAMQISQHLISAAKYTGIRIATVVGGLAAVKQERVLSKGPEIVVATPGRLWELLKQGQPHLEQVDNVKFLAIDETDRMLERGHFLELKPLLERLNSRACKRQSYVMSATLTVVHRLPTRLSGNKVTKRGKILNRKVTDMTPENKIKKLISLIGMTDPKVVDITADNLGAADTLTECKIACSLEQKDHYLYYILKRHPGRTLVFCNSIGSVKRLAQLFSLLKCSPLPLHAGMPQRQRLKNLERFRDDPRGVLVATDVAARGLDVPDVDHVLHYQVPRTAENYVHRSGRTARASKEGLTIVLMDPSEAVLYAKLCRTLNKKTEPPTFPVPSHVLNSMKDIVSLARDVDRLQLAHRRAAQETGWLDKAARDMDIIVDEDFLPRQHVATTTSKVLQQKKKQLDALISKPLFPRGFSYKFPTLNDPSALTARSEENALTVMKNAIQTGSLKRERRKSKNAPLLKLQKDLMKK